ncbi:M56 family metallopeptidase [Anaerotignum lactatifermentans]|uniref:M56 family metallopeptidase n=1 Tax=Anaerotignum lactatifermentans TaxID=160404 RepID=UPI00267141A2|nr:M56 family metallopeptidase [Anaerotignum lactatifermentans]
MEWFQTFLVLSVAGSFLAGILLVLKKWTGKQFSPTWQYVLWVGVLLVMVVPISVKVPALVQPLQEKQVVQTVPLPEEQTMTEQPVPVDTVEAPAGEILPFTEETALPPISWWDVLAVIWVLGALGSLGYRLTGYFRFSRHIRRTGEPMELDGVPKRLRVRKTSAAVSPMVMGMIRPTLILPETALTESRLPYVLRHELVHYRRGDIFWRWLAVLATSIHWFNPMVYVAAAQMQEACEISCDWCVVRSMEQAKRDDYMRVILELLAEAMAKKQILTTQMASEKKQLQRRFTMIRNQKPVGMKKLLLSVCVGTALLGAAWLTGCTLRETYVTKEPAVETADEIGSLAEDGSLLFVGVDDYGVPDTIFTYEMSEEGKATIYSIPRDTFVTDNMKIAALLIQENGDEKLIEAVSEITGRPVKDYVRMDLTAAEAVIDALGGVTFTVPQDMYYSDPYQDLFIDLKAGEQTLSGKDAVSLLRYRKGYPEGDLKRVEVQQAFLMELFRQKCNPAYLKEIPAVMDAIKGHVITNLIAEDVVKYGEELYHLKQNGMDAVEMYTLQNGDMYYETAQEGGGMGLFAEQSADVLTNDDSFATEQPALVPVGQ